MRFCPPNFGFSNITNLRLKSKQKGINCSTQPPGWAIVKFPRVSKLILYIMANISRVLYEKRIIVAAFKTKRWNVHKFTLYLNESQYYQRRIIKTCAPLGEEMFFKQHRWFPLMYLPNAHKIKCRKWPMHEIRTQVFILGLQKVEM